jgi:hypothetical protein
MARVAVVTGGTRGIDAAIRKAADGPTKVAELIDHYRAECASPYLSALAGLHQ